MRSFRGRRIPTSIPARNSALGRLDGQEGSGVLGLHPGKSSSEQAQEWVLW